MSTLEGRLRGAMWGLLVGDALGVPYEFHPPSGLPPIEQLEMEPPFGFDRAHSTVPAGTWSDDGAQALCLAEALIESEADLFYSRLSNKLVAWRDSGHMAVGQVVFDIGGATNSAINCLQVRRDDGRSCGGIEEHCLGNGALMRVLPLALWQSNLSALIEHSMQQSRLTHGHPVSQLCCAIYCVWVRGLLQDQRSGWADVLETVARQVPSNFESHWNRILTELEQPAGGSGYVVDTLRSARWAVEAHGDFESTVKAAISLGHDTDTTACVAGGAAGAVYGQAGIPARWLGSLRGRSVAGPLINQLIAQGVRP